MRSERFQVLSLDGGGYKGIFSAAVLAQLEADLDIRVCDHFDLVAGTSTGGIIALGLGLGIRPIEIVDFYRREGATIFGRGRRRAVRRVFRAKYRQGPLKRALEQVFGDHLLCESRVPLIIPSYDLRSDDVYLFRTPHIARLRRDWKERMVDIALATSAAPTYLPAHHLRDLRLIDGGVWANNPAAVALAEAIGVFRASLDDVHVFSLGTTNSVEPRPDRLDSGGAFAWRSDVTKVVLRGQSVGARNTVRHILGDDHVLRVDPKVPDGVVRLDHVTPGELMGRAETESRHVSEAFQKQFADHTPRPYVPCHSN